MAKNNFDDLKATLMDTFNMVAEKVLDLADTAADTAKAGHQIAKLTMEKKKAESAMQEAYEQLGKLYYDMHRDDAEGVFADLCGDIESSHDKILDIEDEITALEEKVAALGVQIEHNASDFVKLQELTEQKTAVEEQLEERTERWMELTELAESM